MFGKTRSARARLEQVLCFHLAHLAMVLHSLIAVSEDIMQLAVTFIAVVAGLVFSLAVALVTEELIFGQLMRLFFHSSDPTIIENKRQH